MRSRILITCAVSAVLLAGCPTEPPPAPSVQNDAWPGVTADGPSAQGITTYRFLGGTTNEWYVTGELSYGSTPESVVAETTAYPRTGPTGETLGSPQVLSPTIYAPTSGLTPPVSVRRPYLGDQLLLTGSAIAGGANQIWVDVAGTWTVGGTFALDPAGERVLAFDDQHVVTRKTATDAPFLDYPISMSGSTVTIGAARPIAVPASWPADFHSSDNTAAALIDDTLYLAMSAGVPGSTGPYQTRLLTADLSGSTPVVDADAYAFGGDTVVRGFDADRDGSSVRVAMGIASGIASGTPNSVAVLRSDAGGPWSLESTLTSPASLGGYQSHFGFAVAIDDDRLVAAGRILTLPGALGDRSVHVVSGFERVGGTWVHVATMTPDHPAVDPTETYRYLVYGMVDLAGTHGAALVVSDATDSPTGVWENWRFEAS